MQKLLSLPPNLIHSFHQLEGVNHTDWFCTSDPVGSKLGSGGGTTGYCRPAIKPLHRKIVSANGLEARKESCCMQEDRAAVCPAMLLRVKY